MDPASNICVTIICSVLASSGLWAFFQRLMDRKYSKKDEEEADRNAEKAMLVGLAHDRITYLGLLYIDRGYIYQDELENLEVYLFKPYEALHGNGSGSKVMSEVRKLPMKKSRLDP